MRIILLSSNMTETGGIQRLTASLANSFINKFDVEIINTGHKKGTEKFFLDKRITNTYINLNSKDLIDLNLFQKLFENIKTFFKMKDFFDNYKFDCDKNIVIALGHSQSCLLPFIIPNKNNIKKIGSQHNPISYNLIYSIIRRFSLIKLDKYVLLNESMAIDFLSHYKLNNTYVIENPNEIKVKYSNLDNKVVIAVGRLTEQKQFNVLIDIWRDISFENPNWKLKIIGDGPKKKELNNQIKQYNLEKKIILQEFNEEIEKEYSKSDILVMTSKYEGFGLVLVEAQSCGLPVVAFDCPTGPKSIINNNEDGFLIENMNLEQFTSKLNILIKDSKLREEMSKKAIKNSKRFNIETITKKWIELFENL